MDSNQLHNAEKERIEQIALFRAAYTELLSHPYEVSSHDLQYLVPELSPDGTCSMSESHHLYSLAEDLFGCEETQALAVYPAVIRKLVALKELVKQFAEKWAIEWLGIYLRHSPRKKHDSHEQNTDEFLLKLAYFGSPSRAIFPLTRAFATVSNNSFCAINATRRIIQNTGQYAGPYYVCDEKVKSEYCSALFSQEALNNLTLREKQQSEISGLLPEETATDTQSGALTLSPLLSGLVDAETFRVNAFTPELIAALEHFSSFVGPLFAELRLELNS